MHTTCRILFRPFAPHSVEGRFAFLAFPKRVLDSAQSCVRTILCMTQPGELTKREAADMLGVTPSTVQRMIDRGTLRPSRTIETNGRRVLHLFRLREIERLVKERAA